jgi:hypothetical protein
MKKFIAIFALLFTFSTATVTAETKTTDIPQTPPTYGVYDPDGLLDSRVEERVRALNEQWSQTTLKPQIAIIIVESLDYSAPIEMVANKVARDWKIGYGDTNNGLLVVVDVAHKKIRTEVSNNLGIIVTDSKAKSLNETIKTNFRQQDYTGGLLDYLDALDALVTPIASENKSIDEMKEDAKKRREKENHGNPVLFIGCLLAYIGFSAYKEVMGDDDDDDDNDEPKGPGSRTRRRRINKMRTSRGYIPMYIPRSSSSSSGSSSSGSGWSSGGWGGGGFGGGGSTGGW